MAEGYIKLYRTLLENPIHKKSDYLNLWITLLLKANHKDVKKIWNGQAMVIKAGQFITGRKSLSAETGITESKVYRILNYLENEHQIKQQKNNAFTVISILNWHKFQGNGTTDEQQIEQPVNNGRTTDEQPVNTDKNVKNVKNDKKKDIYAEFVKLTEEENKKLIEQFGETKTNELINNLSLYIGSKGDKYKSHYHTILMWERKNKSDINKPKPIGRKYESY